MEETKQIEFSNRVYLLGAVLVAVVVISYLGGLFFQYKMLPQSYLPEVSFTGEGKAYAKPDVATIVLGMHTQGMKSREVVDENNKVVNKAIESVKEAGVEEKDVKTTLYSLYPIYDYTEEGRVFRGYTLDQQIAVKIRSFEKISDILDKAASLGMNTIGDLRFEVDDIEKVKAEARGKAIEGAKIKAEETAKQAGLKLLKLTNIYEGGGCCYPQPMYGVEAMGGAVAKESVAPSIQAGQTEITSSVTLTYRVK